MIKFETLELAVYMAEEFRAGRYGFILFNPELKKFGLIGPLKKSEKIKFTSNAATYSFLKVDNKVSSYTVVKAMFEMGLFEPIEVGKIYSY